MLAQMQALCEGASEGKPTLEGAAGLCERAHFNAPPVICSP